MVKVDRQQVFSCMHVCIPIKNQRFCMSHNVPQKNFSPVCGVIHELVQSPVPVPSSAQCVEELSVELGYG